MKKKIALITGITGQDGAYLANLLLNKGYKIYGTYRRTSSLNLWRLEELGILESIELLPLELLEKSNIERVIKLIKPNEIYNLAAQSFVSLSFENPIYTAKTDAIGVLRILESIRYIDKKIKFYQASSSEMFGESSKKLLNEQSPFHPRSPYGSAKAALEVYLQGLRQELHGNGSKGLLIKPGPIVSPMTEHMQKSFLWSTPEKVAFDINRAIKKRKEVFYTPRYWFFIMFFLKLIPEKFYILHYVADEQQKKIFLWLREDGVPHPMSYVIPYTRLEHKQLHRKTLEAQKSKGAKGIRGKRKLREDNRYGLEIEAYKFVDQKNIRKDGVDK